MGKREGRHQHGLFTEQMNARRAGPTGCLQQRYQDESKLSGATFTPKPASKPAPAASHCRANWLCSSMCSASQGYITHASPSTSCAAAAMAAGSRRGAGMLTGCAMDGTYGAGAAPQRASRPSTSTSTSAATSRKERQPAQRATRLAHNVRHALRQLRLLRPQLVVDDKAAQPRRRRRRRACKHDAAAGGRSGAASAVNRPDASSRPGRGWRHHGAQQDR